jgi:hypothetical protein
LTVTAKAASPVSVSAKKAAKKPTKNTNPVERRAQSQRATKRWANVPPEERRAHAVEMVGMRWASAKDGYADAEHYFKVTDLDEAADSYQQMRNIYEMAGKVLDTRFQEERQNEERCSNKACPFEPGGKRFDRNNPWFYRNAQKDPLTGRLYNVFACSPQCMVAVGAPGTKGREAPVTDARSPNFQPPRGAANA